MYQSTHILLADDQPKVCSALRLLLEQQPWGLRIIEAANAAELLENLQGGCPKLVLLDWELPGAPPDEILRTIKTTCPTLEVIAMSVNLEAGRAALNAGADAFVSKGDPPSRLLSTLHTLLFENGNHPGEDFPDDKSALIE